MITDLLASVLQSITDLIPRINRRPKENEWGVVDSPFGCWVFWRPRLSIPVMQQIEYWPASKVPICLEGQRITTADGKAVTVNCTLIGQILDPLKLRKHYCLEDWEAGIAAECRAEISETVRGHNLSHLSSMEPVDFLSRGVLKYWEEHGFFISELSIEDMVEVFPLALIGDSSGG